MKSFKDVYNDMYSTSGTRRFVHGPRHRKDTFTDVDRYYRRQRQNLVGDMYKKDNSENSKIDLLKNGSSGSQVCNQQDLQYIQRVFGITLDGKPKMLGKTGIKMTKDVHTGNYILTK